MKIRTRIIISVVILCVIFLILAVSVFYTAQQVSRMNAQEELARKIQTGSYELGFLADDYLVYGEDRQLAQWNEKFESFSEDLSQLNAETPEQQQLVNNIRANQQRLKEIFDGVVSTRKAEKETGKTPADQGFIALSWSRLGVQNQAMIFDASRLAELIHAESGRAQQQNTTLSFAALGVLVIVLLSAYFIFSRSVLGSLDRLQQDTRVVGAGNLDYLIDESSDDETGDLARAFNRMTASLKTVTASKAELETEVAERKKAEEALKVKNTDLEAAYEELTATEEELRQNYDELARNERALAASEMRLRRFYDSDLIGVIYWNMAGQITDANDRFLSMTGYTREDLMDGRIDWAKMTPPEFRHRDEQSMEELKATGMNRVPFEKEYIRKDGSRLPIMVSGAMIDDQRYNGVAIVIDITERKRAEEELLKKNTDLEAAYEEITATGDELKKLNEQLEERVRQRTSELAAANRELESFTYSVSHDLRAPLRAIHGFSRIIMEEHAQGLNPEVRRYLEIINENGLRMGNLIDDLLTFSRTSRQSLKREMIQPGEIVKQCLAELGDEQKGRAIELDIAALPACNADPALLKIVWMNLIANAIKFTRHAPVARITIASEQKDDETMYFIRDNGAGFDMKYIGKLFGVFQRLHHAEEYEGNGVGLAIVKMIITRHGGRVWAEGEVGKGATFFYTLGKGDVSNGDRNGQSD